MALCCAIDLWPQDFAARPSSHPSYPRKVHRLRIPLQVACPWGAWWGKWSPSKKEQHPTLWEGGGCGFGSWNGMGCSSHMSPPLKSQLQLTGLQPLVQCHAMMGTSFCLETITQAESSTCLQ